MDEKTILKIEGEVKRPSMMTFNDLEQLDASVQIVDVSAVDPSRQGGAVRLSGLLELVGASPDAPFIGIHSSHDDFHASVPLEELRERAFLIYRLDGQVLPREKGGPVRFYIPDHASCKADDIDECANVKFVDHIEITNQRGFDNRPQDEEEHAKLHGHQ